MGRILVSEFTTLDGVIGVPAFTFAHPFTEAQGQAMARITALGSEAILFGRTTWQESGPRRGPAGPWLRTPVHRSSMTPPSTSCPRR
jgi:dihydrofolate reductase